MSWLLLALYCFLRVDSVISTQSESYCKAFPGSRHWPSEAEWYHLNQTLGGRLLAPPPPGGVCHRDQRTYSAERCNIVSEQWTNYHLHTEDPISVAGDLFSNFSCLPNPNYSCSDRAYPAYVVNASTAEHVKVGIDFVRSHRVRLVVKSTGHDYLGRSIAPGALSIWLHHMKKTEFHPAGSLKRAGSGRLVEGNSITVGGGAQMFDLYRAAGRHDQTVVAGSPHAVSVGISGYVTGGGTSFLAPRFGLAADNVVQMEVVTASGEIVTVNDDYESNLFWALRGGGGSTFGVITKITLWTYPSPRITSVTWMATTALNASCFWELGAYFASKLPEITEAGLSGYFGINPIMTNPDNTTGAPKEISAVAGSGILQDNHDPDAVTKIFKPLNDTINDEWPGNVILSVNTQQFPSILAWFEETSNWEGAGWGGYLASWILDRQALTGNAEALSRALQVASGPFGNQSITLITGPAMHNTTPPGVGNAVQPAWRRGEALALTSIVVPNKTVENWAIKALDESYQPLRDLAPCSGSYVNEGLPFEENWRWHFWGSNYERLREYKRMVDPDDIFWCPGCVGNDFWKQKENGQLCRWDSL